MLVLISGPDGSGKTTIAKLMVRVLQKRGYPVIYIWLRFPRLFSTFPLLISKIIGTTIPIKLNNTCRYTYHYYVAIPILGKLYELTILVDYIIYKLIKALIPSMLGFIVVVDRNLLDIAIDVYIERQALPKLLLHYLSREAKNSSTKIVVLASLRNLLARRRDNLCNPHTKMLPILYRCLGSIYGYNIAYNDTRRDLARIVSNVTSSFKPIRVYSDPRNQLLRALFLKHRWLIFITNFLFQTMGYMWKAELVFRLVIQGLVTIALMLLGLHVAPALLISHIIMYPFYSNFFAILKWWMGEKKRVDIDKFMKGLKKLKNIENRYSNYIDIVIVGSLARDPNILSMRINRTADIDARIVPKPRFSCILLSMLIAMYIRLWGMVNRIPLDLYVKPNNDPEMHCSIHLRDALNMLKTYNKTTDIIS